MPIKIVWRILGLTLLFALLTLVAACGNGGESQPAEGQTSPETGETDQRGDSKVLSIATTPVGSSINAVGNGLASVISKHSSLKVAVQPFAGPTAYVDPFNEGEVMLAVHAAPDLTWAFYGEEPYKEPIKNLRLLTYGNTIEVAGAAVRLDSGIKKMADLKGKRVTSEYSGDPISIAVLTAALAVNGLSWDDVIPVPTVSYETAVNALRDDRADAMFALVPTTPLMMDAHNAVGLASVPFLDDYSADQIDQIPDEKLAQVREYIPGVNFTVIEPAGYITEKTLGISYPNIFVASAHLADEVAYEILETLWEHYEELHPVHVWLSSWTPERMFEPDFQLPYHPGAVQFFKDQGLWTDEMEQRQAELLKAAQ